MRLNTQRHEPMSEEQQTTEEETTTHESPVTAPDEQVLEETVTEVPNETIEPTRSTVPTGSQLLVAIALLGSIFGLSYLPWLTMTTEKPSTLEEALRNDAKNINTATIPEPELEATSAFIWDVKKQRALLNKNASAQLPLASLTKLMTSLVALESLPQNAKVAMTLDAILQDGPSDFLDGESFDAQELSDFALVSSSNDGAYALAAAAGAALLEQGVATTTFIDAMNIRAEELGMTQTYFSNTTGLDENESESGSYGSARDVAFLMEYLIRRRPEIVEGSVKKHAEVAGSALHTATNTNEIVERIPGLLATKTGFTDLAGGNLVIAFDAGLNRPIVVSVLGSTREGRFKDVLALVEYAQQRITEENN